jgi:hypothetical protein
MDMPNAIGLNVTIYPDGRVVEYLGSGGKRIVGTAVSLPEKHGRLIDADAMKRIWMGARIDGDIGILLDARPTIVEAEGK